MSSISAHAAKARYLSRNCILIVLAVTILSCSTKSDVSLARNVGAQLLQNHREEGFETRFEATGLVFQIPPVGCWDISNCC